MAARIKKAARKVQRLGVIKRGGGATLVACRAIAAGAARYGAKVMGLPDRLLGRTRRLVRTGTSSKAGGSSLTLDLSLQKCRRVDPAFMANAEPLVKWVKEVYAASSERMADLDEAWRAAVGVVGLAANPWEQVVGPAGAVIATMRRIGWAMVSARHFRTKEAR